MEQREVTDTSHLACSCGFPGPSAASVLRSAVREEASGAAPSAARPAEGLPQSSGKTPARALRFTTQNPEHISHRSSGGARAKCPTVQQGCIRCPRPGEEGEPINTSAQDNSLNLPSARAKRRPVGCPSATHSPTKAAWPLQQRSRGQEGRGRGEPLERQEGRGSPLESCGTRLRVPDGLKWGCL